MIERTSLKKKKKKITKEEKKGFETGKKCYWVKYPSHRKQTRFHVFWLFR